jgi:DNA-damage-inducible protein J
MPVETKCCDVATKALHICVSKSTTIRARIEPALKAEVESILGKLGLTASETIHLLYRQIQLRRGLPFEIVIPSPLTAKVLEGSKSGKM